VSGRVFEAAYASTYDLVYAEKDYERECDFVEEALNRFGDGRREAILDMGCGTGGHAIPLARRGYRVTGIDRSAAMIEIAKRKAAEGPMNVAWHVGDVRSTRVPGTFDAALLMFAVLGYQTSNADVLGTLRNARRHLRPGGVLVFDVWYGVPVLREGPSDRLKVVGDEGHEVIRAVSATLHTERNVVDVRIRTWDVNGQRVHARSDEVHAMRFFFPAELELCLSTCGFRAAVVCAFPDLDTPPDQRNWNLGCVAVAVGATPA